MFRFSSFIVTLLVASVLPHCSYGILEEELTAALQAALAPHDPIVFPRINDLHVVTDHADLVFNANDTVHGGFSNIVVTFFQPPVPLVSKQTKVDAVVNVTFRTEDYSLAGTFNGEEMYSSGTADLEFILFGLNVDFLTEEITLDPLGGCIEEGSLVMDFTIGSMIADFEGAEEISAHIEEEAQALIEIAQNIFNENSLALEEFLNSLACVAAAFRAP
ncbi:uncharacterized protein [Procambarus clarkii]|uniref:uncharacterized protein n=1 Tax=Procambarus clarkii TaxID=6728 RepID=UPI001E6771E4|nr:uncharacterized protein LOC123767722 [Procambarus clarkii]